ncbi:MAG: hypothetical protein ACYDBB_00930 [Armatimonadota bacterium]
MTHTELTMAAQLQRIGHAPPAEKADIIQALYEQVAFHASGIMYSMQRLADGVIRPFTADDFVGKTSLDATVGKLQLDGPWDYLHGENSITTSGLYLAAQAYRIKAGGGAAAMDQAARAFHSLELIYELGVRAGTPGWMCKPYGFRLSNQTSADQYLDACWGLYTYYAVAPPAHRRRIEEMVVAFADYWRTVDYTLTYFGNVWSQKEEPSYPNAVMMLINVLAYHFTGNPVYRREAEWFRDRQFWMERNGAEEFRRQAEAQWTETGQIEAVTSWMPWVTPQLKPGEVLFWENAGLCKYVVVAAEIIQELQPDLLGDHLSSLMEKWWRHGQYGIGEDALPYYWYALDLRNDTWRPLAATDPLPREDWPFGDPFMSYISEVRWCDPLARALSTSVIAQRHAPAIADAARAQAQRLLAQVDATRLHWMVDPDGRQLLSELGYYGQCLSSEVPATFLAAYWRGRVDGLW